MDQNGKVPPASAQVQNLLLSERPHSTQTSTETTNGKSVKANIYTADEFERLHPRPVPLPTAPKSSGAVGKLNHLCQVHSVVATFTINEVSKGLFASKVDFNGHVCEGAGPFLSKKAAKDAVAQSALEVLQHVELPTKDERKAEKEKRKSGHLEPAEENWVSIVHTFTQQKGDGEQPDFQYFEFDNIAEQKLGMSDSPKQFSCTLRLQARPHHTFGSENFRCTTKAEAKRLAAKDAVKWLRVMDFVPNSISEMSSKRRKSTEDGQAHKGLSQQVSRLTTDQSPAQRVVDLSLQLGLSPPTFDMKPCALQEGGPIVRGLFVCAASYLEQDVQREPRLRGPLCQTPRVYGQKTAKQSCCKALIVLLEEIEADRRMEA